MSQPLHGVLQKNSRLSCHDTRITLSTHFFDGVQGKVYGDEQSFSGWCWFELAKIKLCSTASSLRGPQSIVLHWRLS